MLSPVLIFQVDRNRFTNTKYHLSYSIRHSYTSYYYEINSLFASVMVGNNIFFISLLQLFYILTYITTVCRALLTFNQIRCNIVKTPSIYSSRHQSNTNLKRIFTNVVLSLLVHTSLLRLLLFLTNYFLRVFKFLRKQFDEQISTVKFWRYVLEHGLVKSGIQQGSVSGSLLFNICILWISRLKLVEWLLRPY